MTTNVPAPEMSSSSGAGRPTIATVCRDIDDLRRSERRLLSSNARLKALLAQAESDRDTFRAQANRGGA